MAGASARPGTVKEGCVGDVGCVQGTGYARSKYVGEEVVLEAARRGADARVLRVGQLVGDTGVGAWNAGEGVPLMIRTAETLGVLPELDEVSFFLSLFGWGPWVCFRESSTDGRCRRCRGYQWTMRRRLRWICVLEKMGETILEVAWLIQNLCITW